MIGTTPKREIRVREVPAVTRAIAILSTLAVSREPLGVTRIGQHVGVIPSTCLHILRALAKEGAVTFDPATKKYALGPGLLAFGAAYVKGNAFVREVQSHLDSLAWQWNVAATAVKLSDDSHFIVTNTASMPHGFSLNVSVGSRFPALISAPGKCLAAFGAWSDDTLAAEFAKLKWQAPPTLEAWFKDVEKARRDGFAIDVGNHIRGITTIAAPVFDDDKAVTQCVAASTLREQLPAAKRDAICADVVKLAAKLQRELYDLA